MLQKKPPDPGLRLDDGKMRGCGFRTCFYVMIPECEVPILRRSTRRGRWSFINIKFLEPERPPRPLRVHPSTGWELCSLPSLAEIPLFSGMTSLLTTHYPLTLTTCTNFESVANRFWANRMAVFTRVFPRAAQNPPKKSKIKNAGFLRFFENFPRATKK